MYHCFEGVLNDATCDFLLNQTDWSKEEDATVVKGEESALNKTLRRTKIVWEEPLSLIGNVLSEFTRAANLIAEWNFDLLFPEKTQMTKYLGADEGYYDWHHDLLPKKSAHEPVRKLSCVALLTDGFEGGELQFADEKNVLTKRGTIVVFPSFVEHRVTPVTAGERITAVSWMLGPAFK